MTKIWILNDIMDETGEVLGAFTTREKVLTRRNEIVAINLAVELAEGSDMTEQEQAKFCEIMKDTYWITEMELE